MKMILMWNVACQIKLTTRNRSASDDLDVTTRCSEGQSEGQEDSEDEEWWEDTFLRTIMTSPCDLYTLLVHNRVCSTGVCSDIPV
jgi:hypothetical protein